MANPIRRNSMEHLELYDLDKVTILSSNYQLPPPLPPPRKHRHHHLPTSSTFERYQFLCDITRHRTDPIYAATPMFTTIPQSKNVKHHRQLLGSRIPRKIINPISSTSPKSPEPKSADTVNNKEEEQKEESSDEDYNQSSDDDDNNDDGGDQSSSSSDNNDNDNILDDDDNKKGIVEQIFNRHKK